MAHSFRGGNIGAGDVLEEEVRRAVLLYDDHGASDD